MHKSTIYLTVSLTLLLFATVAAQTDDCFISDIKIPCDSSKRNSLVIASSSIQQSSVRNIIAEDSLRLKKVCRTPGFKEQPCESAKSILDRQIFAGQNTLKNNKVLVLALAILPILLYLFFRLSKRITKPKE